MSSKISDTMVKMPDAAPRPRGRPRGFDTGKALEAATCVFWTEGYASASVDQLCREMQMPRASLYQTFGDKEQLFLAAIKHYAETRITPLAHALGPHGSLQDDLERFFESVVALSTHSTTMPGCLISCVLADTAGASPLFRAELDRRFATMESWIADRLRYAPETPRTTANVLAVVVASTARGITLRARSGATAAELAPVARAAARSFAYSAGV